MKYLSSFSLTLKPAWTGFQDGGSPPSVNDLANTHSSVKNVFLSGFLFCTNYLKTFEMTGEIKNYKFISWQLEETEPYFRHQIFLVYFWHLSFLTPICPLLSKYSESPQRHGPTVPPPWFQQFPQTSISKASYAPTLYTHLQNGIYYRLSFLN